jgi:hypothetical protein
MRNNTGTVGNGVSYVVRAKELYCEDTSRAVVSNLLRDKPIFSSERTLHKDYDCKGSVEKIPGRDLQGAWHPEELIGGKRPVVNQF